MTRAFSMHSIFSWFAAKKQVSRQPIAEPGAADAPSTPSLHRRRIGIVPSGIDPLPGRASTGIESSRTPLLSDNTTHPRSHPALAATPDLLNRTAGKNS